MSSTIQRSGLPLPASPSSPKENSRTGMPTITPRRSLVSLRQSFNGNSNPSTPRRGSITPNPVPALPTPTAASRYASSSKSSVLGPKKGKQLEIGDEVVMDGTSLIGVLRHLGPVAFKPGEYAGLELIGNSTGQGKNDGSVQGVQYFACDPGNGIFCPAHKVSPLSTEAPTEATARPQSSLSARSGRSSVAGENRPASAASSNRSRSSTISNVPRPPSTTPGRTPSRNAINRPGSSLGSRPTNGTASVTRLLPRKSVADGLADEEGRRRAKTSAEEAAKAEGRITAGSRAYRFLNMNAKDLEANGKSEAAADLFSSTSGAKEGVASPNSPLKDSLLGSNRAQTGLATPKSRMSFGASGMPTPRAGKPRVSIFGSKSSSNGTGMLPPSLPTNNGSEEGRRVFNGRQSLGPPSSFPRTPSRMARASLQRSDVEGEATSTPSNTTQLKVKNQMLLEEMDLTPKRDSKIVQPSQVDQDRLSTRDAESGDEADVAGFALTTSDVEAEETLQAKVPLSLYEQSTLESARLKAHLNEVTKQLQQAQADVERAKIRAQQESQKELEEERRVEREDETRRRRELEGKEKEAKDKIEVLTKEVKKLTDDAKRVQSEGDKKTRDAEARLQESEKLVEKLKGTLDNGGASSKEVEGRIKAKDLELDQLTQRINRLAEERDKEREEHLREMDDLKAAGEEAFDIFQKEQALSNEIIQETENKMAMLEARAQEAIVEVEQQRDEALKGIKPNSVAEIDHQSLQEQLGQAQKRIVSLEDQLEESNLVMQQEREANIKRKDRFTELEGKLKSELTRAKSEFKRANGSEVEARNRIEELTEALKETRTALENERAELEILRTEALVIGDDQRSQPLNEREKSRFEGEIERLNGLLEGARSGKREASRKVEEQSKEISELHSLVEEVRSHLKVVESDRQALIGKLSGEGILEDQGGIIIDLRRAVESKTKEVETLQRSNQPLSEQVSSLVDSHRRDLQTKEEELSSLRRKLEDSTKRHSGSRYSLTVPSSLGGGGSFDMTSPVLDAGNSPSAQSSKRFSSASMQSRRSRNSMGALNGSPDHTSKEMAGLRSIVNTLNQELTESKVNSMQQERELKSEVEYWKEETRKWQLTVESIKGGEGEGEEATVARNQAIERQLEVEKKLNESQQQVQRFKQKLEAIELKKREEVEKLNQDIAELEALCEATVWRREEQEAKRQELERQVSKLQRRLERAMNGEKVSTDSVPTALPKDEIVCDDCGEVGHRMGDDCPYSKDDLLF